jgi:hypothetical protein
MKNFALKILSLCIITVIFACTSEIETVNNDVSISSKIEVFNGALKFENIAVRDSIVVLLASFSSDERKAFYDELGFVPISQVLDEADRELESLMTLQSPEDFMDQYEAYKSKYNDILMFEDIDIDDLSPYTGIIDLGEEFIVNPEGYYFVGNSKITAKKFNSCSEMKQTTIPVTTRSVEKSNYLSPANHAYSHTNDRKVGLYLSISGSAVFGRFTSQKKGLFGWVRYETVYHAEFAFNHNFDFYDISYYQPILTNGGTYHELNTGEQSGNYSFFLGYVSYGGLSCTGTMFCWSRGVSYNDGGAALIRLYN